MRPPVRTTFPDSRLDRVDTAPGDFPGGKDGSKSTVLGRRFGGLNGGPTFPPNEDVSSDRNWNAIVGNCGQESACG